MPRMTPEELEAHVAKELQLKAEVQELIEKMRVSDYRTKAEKSYWGEVLAEKRAELRAHVTGPLDNAE